MAKPEGSRGCFKQPAWGCMLTVCLALAASPAGAQDIFGKSLGGYPLCEASAALAVDCPGSKGEACILVADVSAD